MLFIALEKFFERIQKEKLDLELLEYERKQWTYHAKGLWSFWADRTAATTIIGSSNFGNIMNFFRLMSFHDC